MPILYGDPISGNCLKARWTAAHLEVPVEWRDVGVLAGETRSLDFLALNADGRVPILVLDDGRVLAESNAIIGFLARGSALIPSDPYDHAKMLQWMFWEQYSHEPFIAVRRYQMRYLGRAEIDLDPRLHKRGSDALALMDAHLSARAFMLDTRPTLADIALVAYTRVAHEGGFDLSRYPAVRDWVGRVEQVFDIHDAS